MMRLREINIRWPWLKVVVLFELVLLVGLGAGAVLRHEGMDVQLAQEVEAAVGGGETNDAAQEGVADETSLSKVAEEKLELRRDLTGKKLVALTFDDGPSRATTPKLLEILKEKEVKANFFLIGQMVEAAPELLQQEIAAGHMVGSHTMSHTNLAKATTENIKWEDTRMRELFQEIVGTELKVMRPPYGEVNDAVRANIVEPMILWSVDPQDWKDKDSAEVAQRVEAAVFDGAVILMHDIYETTVEAVGKVIDDLRAQGYEFVRLDEMAEARGVKLEQGQTYREFRP